MTGHHDGRYRSDRHHSLVVYENCLMAFDALTIHREYSHVHEGNERGYADKAPLKINGTIFF
jgi:hypothetical protein